MEQEKKLILIQEIHNIRSLFFRNHEKFNNQEVKQFWKSIDIIEKILV